MRSRPRLLDRWMDRILALDVDGLLELYHPEATLDGEPGPFRGRDEITAHLQRFARKLRGMRIDLLDDIREEGGRLVFTTHVTSRLGEAHLRHAWQTDGTHILHHGIERVTPMAVAG